MSAKIVIFGEVLYDCFDKQSRILGGAPFNVAWGLQGLGQSPLFISAVGQDEDGRAIQDTMKKWQMNMSGLSLLPDQKTGEVIVTEKDNEPEYEICSPRAWDFIPDQGHAATELIYHGSLALRSRANAQTLEAIMERSHTDRYFDVNLREPYYEIETLRRQIEGVQWLKLNIHELSLLLDQETPFEASEKPVAQLRERFSVANVILTAGADGALIAGAYGEAVLSPAPPVHTFIDSVGAGDAFSAMSIDGILKERSAQEIIEQASRFAAKVCGLRGATTRDTTFYTLKNDV